MDFKWQSQVTYYIIEITKNILSFQKKDANQYTCENGLSRKNYLQVVK